MKLKKLVVSALVATMGVGLLVGCGKTDKPANSGGEKQVEITWWAFPTFKKVDDTAGKYEEGLAKKFMEANPNIKVKVEMLDFKNGGEKLTTAIQGNTAPDVLFDAPGRIIDYGRSGKLVKLNEMVKENKLEEDITNPNILEASRVGQDYYMYPTSAAPFVMAVNKTYLEKEGLLDKVNLKGDRTWTTEQFIELSKEMASKGYKGAEIYAGGQGGDQGTRAFVTNLTGARLMNDDLSKYTLDTKEGSEAYDLVMKGVKEGWLEGNTGGVANDALDHFTTPVGAKFWSVILWSPNLHAARQAQLDEAKLEAVAVSLPSKDGKPNLEYLVNGYAIFDNKDADKIEASKKFVTWLADDATVGKENVIATACFPVRKSFGELYSGNENMKFYNDQNKYYGKYYNTVPGFAAMRKFWYESLQAVISGGKTADEAAKMYTEQANKTLAE